MKLTTLCFLVRGNEVLLAMKKRGFGAGKFNGVGGKVKNGESIVEAAIRETEEEIGVKIATDAAQHQAKLRFTFECEQKWNQECHVFVAKKWHGEPVESDEMKPAWFPEDKLPFAEMWTDDPLWLPKVLAGESLEAEFHFSSDGKSVLWHRVVVV